MSSVSGLFRNDIVRGLVVIAAIAAPAALAIPAAAQSPERLKDGIALKVGERRLELRVCRDDLVRVVDAPPGAVLRAPVAHDRGRRLPADAVRGEGGRGSGVDADDETADGPRRARRAAPSRSSTARGARCSPRSPAAATLEPAEVMGEKTFHVRAEFQPPAGEALYGLGAHQNGWMNYAGRDVDMYQHNIVDVVPFLASSRGYGLLWDNTSHTKFGDRASRSTCPATEPLRRRGPPGRPHRARTGRATATTGTVVGTRVDAQIAFGAPEDRPAVTAIHQAPQVTNAAAPPAARAGRRLRHLGRRDRDRRRRRLRPHDVREQRRAAVARRPAASSTPGARAGCPGGTRSGSSPERSERHKIRLEWRRDDGEGTLRLKWKTPPRPRRTRRSGPRSATAIDYWFVYGPDLDDVVAGYRG